MGACTHGVDAERVRASEHAGHARVQLQDPAVSDDAVTATGSRAGGLRDGAEGAGSNARPAFKQRSGTLTSKAPSSAAPPGSGWSCTWRTRSTPSRTG